MSEETDSERITQDLKRVARILDRDWLSLREYRRHGQLGVKSILRSFETWNKAVAAAGLTPLAQGPGSHLTREHPTREDVLQEIRRVARVTNKNTVTTADFRKHAPISLRTVGRLFGTWTAAVGEAGMTTLPPLTKIPEAELQAEFMRVYEDLGKVPTMYEFDARSRFSSSTYTSRFGGWRRVVGHYLPGEMADSEPPAPSRSPRRAVGPRPTTPPRARGAAVPRGKRLFGPLLNFRGLRHEPIDEQGVVFLFGMVARDLGFHVESVRVQFPDCRAKRLVKGERYVDVDIELEFKARNFIAEHGHDPKGCDLIVCWVNDWPDSPLEVIELKSAIKGLDPDA